MKLSAGCNESLQLSGRAGGEGEGGCASSSLAVGILGALIPELSPHALDLPLPRPLGGPTRGSSTAAGSLKG